MAFFIAYYKIILHVLTIPLLLYVGILLKKYHNNYVTNSVKVANHTLFENLNMAIHELINFKLTSNLSNRRVFLKMTVIKFEIWRDEAMKLAIELDETQLSRMQLLKRLLQWEINTVRMYSEKWQSENIDKVIRSYYNTWHQPKVDKFHLSINQIFANTEIYGSYKSTLIAVFDKLDNLLLQTQSDIVHLIFMKHLNGDFVGIKYNGTPVNDAEWEIFREVNFLK